VTDHHVADVEQRRTPMELVGVDRPARVHAAQQVGKAQHIGSSVPAAGLQLRNARQLQPPPEASGQGLRHIVVDAARHLATAQLAPGRRPAG
jgi:hypothetical protein